MERLYKIIYTLTQRLAELGQVALFFIMAIIVANITMRYFWGPIKGTYEIVEVLGALLLSLGAAYCAITRSNIAVDFAVEKLSPRKQALVDSFTNLVSFLFIAFISWGVLQYAETIYQRGRETTALGIPLYPVCYMVFFGILLLAIVVLIEFIRSIGLMFKEGRRHR